MKTVKIIEGCAGNYKGKDFSYGVGDVDRVEDDLANDLINHGIAEIDDSKKEDQPTAKIITDPGKTPTVQTRPVTQTVKRKRKRR